MAKYYYKKNSRNLKKYLRLLSVLFLLAGLSVIGYILLPFISWQIYFQPVFASQNITIPIPKGDIINLSSIARDYTKAENWFPKFNPSTRFTRSGQVQANMPSYTISISAINIENAVVSTVDTDLTKHLVNYGGTGIPGEKGNAVIFGHSTLPQLFNPKDYKTIFANAYKLKNKDTIIVRLNNVTYTYKVFRTIVVDPSDTSALVQDYNNYYLTLVTCTPPGTIWKRLIVKARLEKI